jgi:hypothetical protein
LAISRFEMFGHQPFSKMFGHHPFSRCNKNSIVAVMPEMNSNFGDSGRKQNKFWHSCRKQTKVAVTPTNKFKLWQLLPSEFKLVHLATICIIKGTQARNIKNNRS